MLSSNFHRVLVILTTLLVALSSARSIYEGIYEGSSDPSLLRRDGDDPPLPPCVVPCGPGCAGPYSDDSPVTPARKRSASLVDEDYPVVKRDFDLVLAGSPPQSTNPSYLDKRNFYKVTGNNVDSFIKNKVKHKDTIKLVYPGPDGDTSTTVQRTFDGTNKVEIGTGGLVGCSVLTVISRRGVFMAHFFESLAFSRPTREQLVEEGQDPDTYPRLNFNGQVRNLIDRSRGATPGLGPALDVSLFNQENDNTQAFIMTPTRWYSAPGTLQFPGRIPEIQRQVLELLPGVLTEVKVEDYVRLNMKDPEQRVELGEDARGAAFFQYDPNNYKRQGWRLFYERELVGEDGW